MPYSLLRWCHFAPCLRLPATSGFYRGMRGYMGALRDRYLRLAGRPLGWLRLETFRRWCFFRLSFRRLCCRALMRDGGLSGRQRALAVVCYQRLSRLGVGTRHSSRCRYTGRARQVSRFALLSRMHFRLASAEGRLPGVWLGRFHR